MQHIAVQSSMIRSIAHEDDVLEVTLTSGRTYRHTGVSADLFAEMQAADSVGRFYNQRIKGQHPFERVEDQAATPDPVQA